MQSCVCVCLCNIHKAVPRVCPCVFQGLKWEPELPLNGEEKYRVVSLSTRKAGGR